MNEKFIYWNDLTPEEKDQATETYICIREAEEERCRDEITKEYSYLIDGNCAECCRFIRKKDGYITVDI